MQVIKYYVITFLMQCMIYSILCCTGKRACFRVRFQYFFYNVSSFKSYSPWGRNYLWHVDKVIPSICLVGIRNYNFVILTSLFDLTEKWNNAFLILLSTISMLTCFFSYTDKLPSTHIFEVILYFHLEMPSCHDLFFKFVCYPYWTESLIFTFLFSYLQKRNSFLQWSIRL